jgi:hypothetical protein
LDKNIFDIATDILTDDIGFIKDFIHQDMKGTRPYRMKPVKTADKIAQYMTTYDTPEKKQMVIQQFGDVGNKYIRKMEELTRGYTDAQGI